MHADLLSSPPPRTPHRMAHRPRSRPRGLTAATLLAATLALVIGVGPAAGDPGADFSALLLYPDIHKDFVVFVYGEDLWRAPADGGDARRLTAHAGQELFPKISPDGRWIAFSAQYTGTRQVWIMPSEGGDPRQLTFYSDVGDMPPRGGYDYWIQGWSPDGKILVRMNRTPWFERMGRYFLVDPEGGLETPIPHIPHGGSASFSPDGKALAYTPIDREFRTWKHSLGGRAQDVWIYDLAGNASRRLTTYRGTDNFPMWSGDRIYFTSDRDFTLELFAYDLSSEEVRPVTTAGDTEWDLLWPSLGPENVVFTRGGRLYRMSLADEAVSSIPIRVGGARPGAVPAFDDVSDNLGDASLSPNGKRVVFDARGDLFSVPAEHGPTRNLTRSQGVREHSPSWSPDGQWIAYLSDASGEYELYLLPRSGGEPRQLTNDGEVWRFAPVWSPDSKRLAYADRKRRLMVVDVATGEQTEADTAHRGDFAGYTFSPDGHWLVYQRVREDSRLLGISLYSIDKAKTYRLGDGLTAEFAPTWSADGKYLFFFSNRDFNLEFSAFEFNYIYNRATRVYAAALDPDAPALFPLRSDEETGASDDGNGDEDSEGKDDGAETLAIDPLGFADRTIALPGVPPGNFGGLAATADAVYFLQEGDGQPFDLQRYDLSKRKAETVASGVAEFELSASGKTILYTRPNGDMHLVDAKPGASGNGKLDLSGLRMKINPRAEWRQMFDDAWRISRDFFYDPNMHGMDWDALGERYRSLLPSVSHRSELDFILGELVGELAAGHTYVANGEVDGVERIEGGMLGAEFEAGDGGRYRISRIYSGENWHDDFRSPLTEPGVNVDEGDYLLAVDGEELRTDDNPFRLLEGKGERVVTLTVNDRPSRDGAREVLVRPIESELNLRYIDWVKSRIALVDELSGGRIGYIHLPDTAIDGNRMMQKLFYGQANKDALIVDDRYNGGGFIPDRMIEYLTRKNMAYWAMRDIDSMRTPNFAHDGPKVMLMNGYSSSGGDALPYFFRQQGLGPLVGSRTWGGLIGLNGNPPLADGGMVQLCTFRIYDDEGNWVVENEGVEPDVEIFDTPEGLADGGDPSIEKAVEILLDQLQRTPVKRPVIPEPPDLGPGR